jgi:hypothetical protein
MLVEHLVEPEFLVSVANSRRNYKDFMREFSRQSPRVIGKLQKFSDFRTKTLLFQCDQATEDEHTMLLEILNFIEEKCLVDRNSIIDDTRSFFENCVVAHQQCPSHVFCLNEKIVENVEGIKLFFSEDFNDGIQTIANQKLVQKDLIKMAEVAADFLRLSSNINFVDPYFSHRRNMLLPMLTFLKLCSANSPVDNKTITILVKDRPAQPAAQYLLDAITKHVEFSASGIKSLSIKTLLEKPNGEAFHNRYMISDLGALLWGIGLDERHSEVNDDVVMLNEELFTKRYEQYSELRAFDVADSATITFED